MAAINLKATFTSRELGLLQLSFPLNNWLIAISALNHTNGRELQIAFQEALTNSIEHGNLELLSEWKDEFDSVGKDKYSLIRKERLESSNYGLRTIEITALFNGKYVVVCIKDEGKGFDVKGIKDIRNLVDSCHGRGLSLIAAYVDRVEFNERGTSITMVKNLIEN
jgi:anti-sigma regulatory factor (Ser/Thr protein kinase)